MELGEQETLTAVIVGGAVPPHPTGRYNKAAMNANQIGRFDVLLTPQLPNQVANMASILMGSSAKSSLVPGSAGGCGPSKTTGGRYVQKSLVQ